MIVILLNKLRAYLTSKGRVVVEYLMIFAVIVLGAVSTNMYLDARTAKKEIATLHYKLSAESQSVMQLKAASVSQVATIEELKEMRRADATAIEGLVTDFKGIADTNKKAEKRLRQLEEDNEEVRKYLNSSIPAPLKCLLNNTCSATTSRSGGKNNTSSNPSASLHTPAGIHHAYHPRYCRFSLQMDKCLVRMFV